MLPAYAFIQEGRVAAGSRACLVAAGSVAFAGGGSACEGGCPQLALDRHGHRPGRPPEPLRLRATDHTRVEALAKEGITFEMARSAAPWTLPLSHDHVHRSLAVPAWGTGRSPYFGRVLDARRAPGCPRLHHRWNRGQCPGLQRGLRLRPRVRLYVDYPRNQVINLNETICNSTLGGFTMNLVRRARLPVPGIARSSCTGPRTRSSATPRQWLNRGAEPQPVGRQRGHYTASLLPLPELHGCARPLPSYGEFRPAVLEGPRSQAIPGITQRRLARGPSA